MGLYILLFVLGTLSGMFMAKKLKPADPQFPVGAVLNSLPEDAIACEVIVADKVFETVEDAQLAIDNSTGIEWFTVDTEDSWALVAKGEEDSRIILRINKKDQLSVIPIEDDFSFIIDCKNFIVDELISNTGIILENHEKVLIFISDFMKFNNPTPDTVSLLNKIKSALFQKNMESTDES